MPDDLRYHLVSWPEGGTSPLKEWSEEPSSKGDGRSSEWRRLCVDIVRWARRGKAGTTELFICLPQRELRKSRDISYLRKLLTWAREHSWGARLFLVASDDIHLSGELGEGRAALRQWLEAACQQKALDLLQISFLAKDTLAAGEQPRQCDWTQIPAVHEEVLSRLRNAASRSSDNRKPVLVARQDRTGPWRCVLSLEHESALDEFLFPLVQRYGVREQANNLLVVVDCGDAGTQVNTVRKARRKYKDRCRLVATLGPPPSPELNGYCVEHALGEALYLRGDLELWYLLLRLNEPSLPWAQQDPTRGDAFEAGGRTWEDGPAIQPILREDRPTFRPAAPGSGATVLVTNSFNPEEQGQCLAAARDVGWLVERAPLELRLVVDPATNRESLIQRIDRRIDRGELDPAIWIHLGHGDGRCGLWEVGSDDPAPPEKWLHCFQGRQLALPLALFLTCKSADIARSFAQAGAGVAIGFEGEIFSDRCRNLADQVFKSVLAHGWHPGAILAGFTQGRSDLIALEDDPAGPIAFVST